MKKTILLLKGENKLGGFLSTLKQQQQSLRSLPNILSNVNFVFSDGDEDINVFDYQLIVLLTNPDERLWEILLVAERNGIPTLNNSNLILKYNDCLQTQLDLQNWGFITPKIGKNGIKKVRFHEMRKNGKTAFLHQYANLSVRSEESYTEQFIEGDLFKIKVLGKKIPYVLHIEQNGVNGFQRTDKTQAYSWLAELGLEIAKKVGADLVSIDIILERTKGLPFCIDINLGNALTGVNNSAIELLTYLAYRVERADNAIKMPELSWTTSFRNSKVTN
ncbi:MAG: hypothetical protein ACXAC6_10005 [Candidatus Hodarchaeales archaeon]